MSACPKCTGSDLYVRFLQHGALINHSGRQKVETEFVTSNQYDFFWQHLSAKDHLLKHCRTCQYAWRENTADQKGESQ